MLREAAAAKVNLYLHVGGKRADGYHALESLVCFAEAGDVLVFEAARTLSLTLGGPFAAGLQAESDNLILRAAQALAAEAGVTAGAAIHLTKNLPVASGIGGGSADAAAALRGLAKLWQCDATTEHLQALALPLGSDVPVCVAAQAARMWGRGEHVEAVAGLPAAPMLLVNPGVAVPTGEVFRRMGRTTNDPPPDAVAWRGAATPAALAAWLSQSRNDMEPAAIAIAPAIGTVLDALRRNGALIARMCGSGATCYALYPDDAARDAAAMALHTAYPGWWVCATRLAG